MIHNFDYVSEGIMVIDHSGVILYVNKSALLFSSKKYDEIINHKFIECFCDDSSNDEFVQTVLDAVYTPEIKHSSTFSYGNDTNKYQILMNTSYMKNGDSSAIIAVFTDVTELMELSDVEKRVNKLNLISNQLKEQNDVILSAFHGCMDDDIITELLEKNNKIGIRFKVRVMHLTLLFIMHPKFMSLAESMDPALYLSMFNKYLDMVTRTVKSHHGTVAEINGDSYIAIFGAPNTSSTHSADAIRSALEIQANMSGLNQFYIKNDFPSMDVMIAAHTEDYPVGNIGSAHAAKFQAFGRNFNLCARIGVTALSGEVVATEGTIQESGLNPIFGRKYQIVPKGMKDPVNVFQILKLEE